MLVVRLLPTALSAGKTEQIALAGPGHRIYLLVELCAVSTYFLTRRTPLLRRRGTIHLTGPHGDRLEGADELTGEHALEWLDRDALEGATGLWEAVEREGAALDGRGRVLVRPSGTEPVVRLMVEAPDEGECDAVLARLTEVAERELG